jgi:hypothetical protein
LGGGAGARGTRAGGVGRATEHGRAAGSMEGMDAEGLLGEGASEWDGPSAYSISDKIKNQHIFCITK